MAALYGALEAGRVGIFESPTGTVRRDGGRRGPGGTEGPAGWGGTVVAGERGQVWARPRSGGSVTERVGPAEGRGAVRASAVAAAAGASSSLFSVAGKVTESYLRGPLLAPRLRGEEAAGGGATSGACGERAGGEEGAESSGASTPRQQRHRRGTGLGYGLCAEEGRAGRGGQAKG